MENTYKPVPFEIELARKIHSGLVKGRVVTKNGTPVRIVCLDYVTKYNPIIALVKYGIEEKIKLFHEDGTYDWEAASPLDLHIELTEEAPVGMTRTEEIEEMAIQARKDYASTGYTVEDFKEYTRDVLKWADEHQPNPWHDAKTDPPKAGVEVIGLWYNKGLYKCVAICVYSRKNKSWNRASAPQFWMQMPELPIGGE